MHVIESLAIKSTDDIHHVFEDDSPMESTRLRLLTRRFYPGESSLLNVELMDIVESLLIRVNSSKDEDVGTTDDGGMSVSWLRCGTVWSVDFVPVI